MPKNTEELLADAIDIIGRQTQLVEKQLHTKAPATSGTFTELHGAGSLFGTQSIERDVISAHMRPFGLGATLPAFPTVFEYPYFAALTGYTGTTGSEPVNPCDPAPAGYVKACNLTAQFGRIVRDTQTIEINEVMRRYNRGDFIDLQLRGNVLGDVGLEVGMSQDNILSIVTKSEMVIAAVNMERKLSTMLWTGNPANNTAGGGYREYPGLDRQIATGQVDAETNTLCPALDSDVKDFAYDEVGGAGRDIVEYMSMLEYYLRTNAEGMGLLPVTWVWVMRPQLWHELSEIWPCAYNTNKCASVMTDANAMVNVLGDQMVAARDQMRQSKTIDVNGVRYPVITDTGIFEHNNINNGNLEAAEYASTIYFLPLRIIGNFPVTYFEHVNYRGAAPDIALLNGRNGFWTDDGRYFWAYEETNFCYLLKMKIEPRVILRTPQLAGRIDAVKYSPLQHTREPDPDSPYWQDGGVSLRADPQTYHVW